MLFKSTTSSFEFLRSKVIIHRSVEKDPIVEEIYRELTPYAAAIVHESYIQSKKCSYKVEYSAKNATLSSSKNSSIITNYHSISMIDPPKCD